MRIKEKISQHRRDFTADYICDGCGHIERGHGYDDAYFHNEVIPAMVCTECNMSGSAISTTPDVPAGVVM